MALRFGDLDPSLSPQSLAAVADFGFTHMTPVQASSIPHFLKNDKLVMFQDRWYVPIAVISSFLVPFALCGWGGLLLVGAVRIVVVHHTTWFINSWAHTGKRRPYNPDVTAADNWLLAVIAFGEGWHNYHHAFPNDYRNGVSALAWDPSKWIISALAFLGLARDLRRVTVPRILHARLVAQKQRVAEAIAARIGRHPLAVQIEESMQRQYEKLLAKLSAAASLTPTSLTKFVE